MCSKSVVLSLVYLAVFAAVAKSDNSSTNVADFLTKGIAGRTFGHNALKRLSFIFLPVMFTLGVISTLLMALAIISVKNLAIGVILLIVSVSQAVSRLFYAASSPGFQLQPRAEYLPAALPASFAAGWPAAASAPLLSPWARSDNEATISD